MTVKKEDDTKEAEIAKILSLRIIAPKLPPMTLTDWTGFLGVAILLLAYLLSLRGTIDKESKTYLLLNFAGAALACLASVLLLYWPFIILEGVWALVSLVSLIRMWRCSNVSM